jgi:hypothetical protein
VAPKATKEDAAPGSNIKKSDAKTYRRNTFPGGKVAAQRTDEGTGTPSKRRDFQTTMSLRTSAAHWCGNPFSPGKSAKKGRIATSLTLLAMTAAERAAWGQNQLHWKDLCAKIDCFPGKRLRKWE